MKRFICALIAVFPASLWAQTAALPIQQCLQNATQAQVQGLSSTNYLTGNIPSCTVTIYLTGTTTLATYYLSPNGTPQTGPFTASASGQFLAYASPNQGYDVVLSGGVPPNTYSTPVTFTDLIPGSGPAISPNQLGTVFLVDGFPSSCSTIGVTGVTGSGGSGLSAGNFALAFSGGGGYGAYGYLNVTSSTAYMVVITDPGTGYTSAPTVTFPTTGTAPTLTATIGNITSSTKADCALAAVKPLVDASCLGTPPYKGQTATLMFGTGVYTTAAGYTLPQNVCGASINLIAESTANYPTGQLDNNEAPTTILRQISPITTAVVYQPPKLAITGTNAYGGNYPSIAIKGITVDPNYNAPEAVQIFGCQKCDFENLSGQSVSYTDAANPTGTYTAGSYNVTLSSGTNVVNGAPIRGLGIPLGDTILSGGGTTSVLITPYPATISETNQQLAIGEDPNASVFEFTDPNGLTDGNGGFGGNAWIYESKADLITAATGSGGPSSPDLSVTTTPGTGAITSVNVVNAQLSTSSAWSFIGGANGNAVLSLPMLSNPTSTIPTNQVFHLNGFSGSGPGAGLNGRTCTALTVSSSNVVCILYQFFTYSGSNTESAAYLGDVAQNYYSGGRLTNTGSAVVSGSGPYTLTAPVVWQSTPYWSEQVATSGFTSSAANNIIWTVTGWTGGTPGTVTMTTASATPGTYTGTIGTYGNSASFAEVPKITFIGHNPITQIVHNSVPVNGDTATLTSLKSASTIATWTGSSATTLTVNSPANIVNGMTVTGGLCPSGSPYIPAATTATISGVTVTISNATNCAMPTGGAQLAFSSSTSTTVTWVTSGATGNQINIAATPQLQAAADYTFFFRLGRFHAG